MGPPRSLLPALAGAICVCGEEAKEREPSELRFEVRIDPDPPCVCQNTMFIGVSDLEGNPMDEASMTVDPQMPIHGHGSTQVPEVDNLGDGDYKAWPVTLIMPGPWEIYIRAEAGGRKGWYDFLVDVPAE